jgi:guanylate kinase
MISSRGFAIVIAAPSGAGKTSLAHALVEKHPDEIEFSVSATTRPKRLYEEASRHYHFVSEAEFDEMAANGELLEYAGIATPAGRAGQRRARGKAVEAPHRPSRT